MTNYITKKYNGITYLGLAACGFLLLFQIFIGFFQTKIDFSVFLQIMDVLHPIQSIIILGLLFSYLNYIKLLPKNHAILIGFALFLAGVYRILDLLLLINLGYANFIETLIRQGPSFALFLLYWKHGIMPKILSILQGLRIFASVILSFVGSSSVGYYISRFLVLIVLAVLISNAIWFLLGIPDLTESPIEQTKPFAVDASNKSLENANGIYPATSGWVHGIPRMAYWCPQCAKSVKFRPKSANELGKAHPCPICQTNLKAWWVEPTKPSYFRFLGGMMLNFGAMITILFETNFGSYGVNPLIVLFSLCIIEIITGTILMYLGMKLNITQCPNYAVETPSLEPQKRFINEMLIIVVAGLFLAFLCYGINIGILSLIFA
ncbi:hypothetical protein [Candidatus Lokiarchaeum ossiferum]|uniref:hypothetical protein n=1 Tax=Candidatus Lokiarchaeum ossiferum TaxID=2951803 RepID=UPI00352C1A3F